MTIALVVKENSRWFIKCEGKRDFCESMRRDWAKVQDCRFHIALNRAKILEGYWEEILLRVKQLNVEGM